MMRVVSIAMLVAAPAFALGCSDSSSCRPPCGVTSTDGSGGGSSTVDTGNGGGKPIRPANVVCKASFAGNYSGTAVKEGQCATVSKGTNSAWALAVKVYDATGSIETFMNFTLGKSPSPGKFGPEGIGTWSVVSLGPGSCAPSQPMCTASCQYSASNNSAPAGTFSLQLSEVDLTDPKPVVHGVVEATQKVQPAPFTNCGIDDFETIAVVF